MDKTIMKSAPAVLTAKRAVRLIPTFIIMTAFFTGLATVAWNPGNYLSSGRNITLIAVPLYVIPFILLAMSVLVLFVYDKNNGVLEYFMSLGMSQKDIYKRYIEASLLLSLIVITIFIPVNVFYSWKVYGTAVLSSILPIYPLAAVFALTIITFMSMCMMTFSSLQKARTGTNQPLGMIIGAASTAPAYIAAALPFTFGVYLDIAIIGGFASAAAAMLILSDRFIRREKLLP